MSADDVIVLDEIILTRRTSLRVDPDRPVAREVVEELCRLATWAPNHHRTQPWRFAAFTGEGRRTLGVTIAEAMAAEGRPEEKVDATRRKYLRAPLVLLVGAAAGRDEVETVENRDAVAAGLQNLLLAATARGLATFWASVATPRHPALLEVCGFEAGTAIVAAVYVGHAQGPCPTPGRDLPAVHWVG